MTVLSVFLIGMKSLIILIPLLIIIRLGVSNSIFGTSACDKEANIQFEKCAMQLVDFGREYRNWGLVNYPSSDITTITKLKKQCEQVPKCFNAAIPGCSNELPVVENLPMWCRRVYFYSGDFAKCSGKVNQISGSVECANEFFNDMFIEKPKEFKCDIMKNNKECILESVNKTCASAMTDVMGTHINMEQTLLNC